MAPTAAESRLPLVAIFLATLASTLLLKPVAANQDVDALSALRRGLQDPNGELKNWDANLVDACTWSHITCDRDNNRVTRIDLNKMNLSGPLAPELGKLDRLQYFREIDHNRLTGPIPRELAGLSNLKHADFSNNNLCGPIPTTGAFQRIPRSSFANNPRLGRKC
ncbi:leucine-rich repeat protein 1-like isoform X1 [Triticum dicoccoides]|uniref:leucine-rich repeat protein 1-like isoform X1 n=1 Tax=Triticum dicoccoides TaxID=85692 RepID=UPI000E7954A4|nr:leucine-rich repeat protein 1-like isoform X1 [Triticum dicoccoides]